MSDVSRRLRDYNNRAYPRGWPLNWLNDVMAYKFF